MKLPAGRLALLCLIASVFSSVTDASMVSALAERKDVTPESFIRSFASFAFELSPQRQTAENFLRRERGDCDDFASLASEVLTERGYKTKLVVVRMAQETHVVCYVQEALGFLDFNHRADAKPIVECDGTLEAIAQKVADDFRSRWQLASEFRYENGMPVYLDNVFPFSTASTKSIAGRATNELHSLQSNLSRPEVTSAIAEAGSFRLP